MMNCPDCKRPLPQLRDSEQDGCCCIPGDIECLRAQVALHRERADEAERALADERSCSTCGGNPGSHPSGLPCVCGDGTRDGETRGLRLAAINAERALEAERAAHAETKRAFARYVDNDDFGIDATPDESYARRILQSHLDANEATYSIGSGGGEVLAEVMNQAQRERVVLLRDAIARFDGYAALKSAHAETQARAAAMREALESIRYDATIGREAYQATSRHLGPVLAAIRDTSDAALDAAKVRP